MHMKEGIKVEENLWKIKKITKEKFISPMTILKDQANFLEKDTENLLRVELVTSQVDNPFNFELKYSLRTEFFIISDAMSGYRYKLLTLYSNPLLRYPVGICNYNNKIHLNVDKYNLDAFCNDEEQFRRALDSLFNKAETIEAITMLYNNSKIASKK